MTLNEIKELLVSADQDIKHYFSAESADAYSFWEETQRLPFVGDDHHPDGDQAWRFYVHRFTRTEGDAVALRIFETLDNDVRTAVRWIIDFENDTGYIHHIFECEGF